MLIKKHPQVKVIYTTIGGGASGSDPFDAAGAADVTKSTLTINLTARAERPGINKQSIEADFRHVLEDVPGVRVKVGLGGASEKYVLALAGEDGRVLTEQAQKVERELRTLPGIGAVTSSSSLVRPEIIVRTDLSLIHI